MRGNGTLNANAAVGVLANGRLFSGGDLWEMRIGAEMGTAEQIQPHKLTTSRCEPDKSSYIPIGHRNWGYALMPTSDTNLCCN